MSVARAEHSVDEAKPVHFFRKACITFVVMGVLYCPVAAWYLHNHPPYVWPVVPPATTNFPSPNAYFAFQSGFPLLRDGTAIENAFYTERATFGPPSKSPVASGPGGPPGYSGAPGGPSPMRPGSSAAVYDSAFPGSTYTESEIEAMVGDNSPLVDAIRKAIPYGFAAPESISEIDSLHYNTQIRSICTLLRFRARIDEYRQNWDDALDCRVDAVLVAEDLIGAPHMSEYFGFSESRLGGRTTWWMVHETSPAAAEREADRLYALAAKIPAASDIAQRAEWAEQRDLMQQFRNPDWRLTYAGDNSDDPDFSESMSNAAIRGRLNSISPAMVMQAYSTYMDQSVKALTQSYPEYAAGAKPTFPSDPITSSFTTNTMDMRVQRERCVCDAELLATQLMLQVYYAKHGSYPPSLAALASAYKLRIPIDPFSNNQALRYSKSGEVYSLYSIGPDFVDDGGVPIQIAGEADTSAFRIESDSTGDIVAGVNY